MYIYILLKRSTFFAYMCHVNEWVSMNGSTSVIVKQSVCTFMFLLLIVKELNGANGKKMGSWPSVVGVQLELIWVA